MHTTVGYHGSEPYAAMPSVRHPPETTIYTFGIFAAPVKFTIVARSCRALIPCGVAPSPATVETGAIVNIKCTDREFEIEPFVRSQQVGALVDSCFM